MFSSQNPTRIRPLPHSPSAPAVVPIGENIVIVVSLVNKGELPLNISGIMGSLNDPTDFSRYLANFTGMPIGELVDAGTEMGLQYAIETSIIPSPTEGQLAITVFYEDGKRTYATTFFNSTITFTSSAITITGMQKGLPYVLAGTVVAAMIFIVSIALRDTKKPKRSRPQAAAGADTDGSDADFVGSIVAPKASGEGSKKKDKKKAQ